MNKAPADVPEPSGWHHAGCRPNGERCELARRITSMSAEENNMALVRRFLEARVRADLNAIEEMMAPDFISHGLRSDQQPDREGYKRQVAEFVTAFSGVRFSIEDQVAVGDKVVSRISGRACDGHHLRDVAGRRTGLGTRLPQGGTQRGQ